MKSNSVREYQLVIWGASGFTGKLVCEHLATEYPGQIRVALAGRSRAKLEAVRDEMTGYGAAFKDVGILVAEAEDRSAVDAMTQATDVVLACAGPFRKYSAPVVRSCLENKTHYLDITGEVMWVRSNIRTYHREAVDRAVKIVHFCGYDCVPTDLGTLFAIETVRKRYQTRCRSIEQLMDGTLQLSGGSVETGRDRLDNFTPQDVERARDPCALTPEHLEVLSGKAMPSVAYNAQVKAWSFPSQLTNVSVMVVARSAALAPQLYGTGLQHTVGKKCDSRVSLFLQLCVFKLFRFLMQARLFRDLLAWMMPAPGTGPSRAFQRDIGRWSVLTVAHAEAPSATPVVVRIADEHGDPGYWSTSKMALECAMSLILDKEKVDATAPCRGGVLTPALAFGLVPLDRLKRSGFVVEVDAA